MTSRRFLLQHPPRVWGPLAVALISASLAGCGTQHTSATPLGITQPSSPLPMQAPNATTPPPSRAPQTEPPIGELLNVTGGDPPMPLDKYMTSMEDLKILAKARELASAACMQSLGFDEWTSGMAGVVPPSTFKEADFFEYLDPELAAKSGYPRNDETTQISDPQSQPKRAATKDEMNALRGNARTTASGKSVPSGGCLAEGRRKVHGAVSALPSDPRDLAIIARTSARNDSRVIKATAEWKNCTSAQGVTYDTPAVARLDIRWASRPADKPADAEERRVASIDAKCQQQTNLVAIYKTVRAAHEQQLLQVSEAKLQESQVTFRRWMETAKAVIAKGG